MRPGTLAEVAAQSLAGDSFDRCFANFLDAFNASPHADRLTDEPPLLAASSRPAGSIQDAYLAAAAEELARRLGAPSPPWVFGNERALRRPWFASPLAALRGVLLLESPPAFRARNLFVSENALSRA